MNDNKPLLITLVVVLVAIVALVGYFIVNSSTEPERVAQRIEIPKPPIEPEPEVVESVATEPVPEIVTAPVPEVPQEPAFVLPPLDDSDPLIRDGVVSLTRHEGVTTPARAVLEYRMAPVVRLASQNISGASSSAHRNTGSLNSKVAQSSSMLRPSLGVCFGVNASRN